MAFLEGCELQDVCSIEQHNNTSTSITC